MAQHEDQTECHREEHGQLEEEPFGEPAEIAGADCSLALSSAEEIISCHVFSPVLRFGQEEYRTLRTELESTEFQPVSQP